MNLQIDYLKYQNDLTVKKENGKKYLYCQVRKKYLVLQPEELVRQLLILYLVNEKKYPLNKISVEKGFAVNDLYRRFDVLVYNDDFNPHLLIECKAPLVNISQETFDQIARYNLAFDVPFLLVTNGFSTYCCAIDKAKETFKFLSKIPSAQKL